MCARRPERRTHWEAVGADQIRKEGAWKTPGRGKGGDRQKRAAHIWDLCKCVGRLKLAAVHAWHTSSGVHIEPTLMHPCWSMYLEHGHAACTPTSSMLKQVWLSLCPSVSWQWRSSSALHASLSVARFVPCVLPCRQNPAPMQTAHLEHAEQGAAVVVQQGRIGR